MSGWLRKRWLLGAAGLAAFSLVVWFTGDLLALGDWRPLESISGRILLIVAAGGVWLGWEWWGGSGCTR